MKKQIAIILPDLSIIGAQRVAIDFGKKLLEFGYEVEWVCGDFGSWSSEVDPSKVILFNSKYFSKIRVVRLFEKMFRLGWLLHKKKYEVVLSVTPFLNRIICFFKFLKLLNSHVVIEEHAYPPRSYLDEFPNRLVRKLYYITEKYYKYANVLRVLTYDTKHYYNSRYIEICVRAFPNLININRILELTTDNDLSAKPNKNDVANLVYLGRFTTQKNIGFLLDCFAKLVLRVPCHLTIIGYGPQEQFLKNKVSLLGLETLVTFKESSKDNYVFLKEANVFPMVSIWEGLPLVIIEAMLLGVPVVSVDCMTGPRYLLGSNSERGWLVPENNVEAYVNALENAICDQDARRDKTAAAKEFAQNNLDIDRCFHEYIKIFIEI